jgi:lipopolysaccharide/colanic/teichoic acid biosynthesis glycosyltransferase
VSESITGRVEAEMLSAEWLLFSSAFRVSRSMLMAKRIASIILASVGLVVALPVMVAVATVIALDSPGGVIFRQKRVGKGGRIFTLYKFRSMQIDAHPERPAEANDPRVTRVGRWMRRVRLDELPQLWNMLKGDMCLIGPRPFTPSAESEYAQHITLYSQRWNVTPGLTGWAQINNGYCATRDDNSEKLSYDLFYIKNMCIGLELLILFQTTKILLLGRGAR